MVLPTTRTSHAASASRFSSSNALNWAKLLCTCYTTMYNTLSKTVLDNNAREVRVARRPATTREFRDLQSALALLDDVIDTEIIQHLFHGDLVQQLNEQYSEFMGDKTQPRLASACGSVRHHLSVCADRGTCRSYLQS